MKITANQINFMIVNPWLLSLEGNEQIQYLEHPCAVYQPFQGEE